MVRSTSVPNLVLWISFEIGNVASDPKDPWSSQLRQQSHRQMWKRQYIPFDNPRQFQHAMVKSRRRKIHREDLSLEMQIFWKRGFEIVAANQKRRNKDPSTQKTYLALPRDWRASDAQWRYIGLSGCSSHSYISPTWEQSNCTDRGLRKYHGRGIIIRHWIFG